MKVILALFLLVAASSAAEVYEIEILRNHIEDLIVETLAYIQTLMKKYDPYSLPDLPQQHLIDDSVDLLISASEIYMYKSSEFSTDLIKVDPIQLTASFQLTFPENHYYGNYQTSGVVWNRTVEGSGPFTLNITKFVQGGSATLDVIDHSIQVTNLTLEFSIGDFNIDVEDLTVEGMTKEEINTVLNQQFIKYILENKALVQDHAAQHTKNLANKLLYGHSLSDVIDWMEKLVASTPDPFPTLSH